MLLALKLILVPALVAGVTLASRRWGPRVGGWFTALPVVAGPALGFYALEQGRAFAAIAAHGTLTGVVGITLFCLTYARSCSRAPWPVCLFAGWFSFGAATTALYVIHPPLAISLIL